VSSGSRAAIDSEAMPNQPADTRMIIAHIDGGSRGNPGPAAYAVIVNTEDGTRLASLSKYLGHATNNIAEYQGLLAALDYAIEHNYRRLRVISDSELLTRQINGQYQVRNPNLKPLHERARAMIGQFESFRIEHVRREQNREADRLVNEAIDAAAGGQKEASPAHFTDPGPIHATATYHHGTLKLNGPLPLAEGEHVELKIERRP